MPCYFCRELETGGNMFLENELAVARWDGYPISPGHAEIIPKRHVQSVEELTEAESLAMMQLVRQASEYIKTVDLQALYEQKLSERHDDKVLYRYYSNVLAAYKKYARPMSAYNIGLNNGEAAGQTVPHVHVHIIPRWEHDIPDPRGGVRNVLPFDDAKDDWDV